MDLNEIINTKKKFLIIDSSSKWLYLSFLIQIGGKIVEVSDKSEENFRNSFQKSSLILKEIFNQYGFPEVIIIGLGPGSFTGIRISVATARNFSQLLKIPVIGIDTLTLYGISFYLEYKISRFMLGIDAKQKKYFCKCFDFDNQIFTEILDLNLNQIFDILEKQSLPLYADDITILKPYENHFKIQLIPMLKTKNFFETLIFILKHQNFEIFFYENYKNIIPIYLRKDPANEKFSMLNEGIK